jgi:Bifunctional DNA primase/polymerase, N-terminal
MTNEAPGRDQPTGGAHQDANRSSVDDHRAQDEALHDGLGGIKSEVVDFALRLVVLMAPVWVASPGEGKGEFHRPMGWQTMTEEGSLNRIRLFRRGMALCVNTGGVLVVVDVDPRNGGDIEKVRNLLVELKVRVFAEVVTPSGGQNFYIAGHPALSTVHSTIKNGKLPGFPGVDVQSFGANVFLPGTQRPKYGGAGYTVVFDDLDALAEGGDPDGAESFSQWVAKCVGPTAKKRAGAGDSDFTFEGPSRGTALRRIPASRRTWTQCCWRTRRQSPRHRQAAATMRSTSRP